MRRIALLLAFAAVLVATACAVTTISNPIDSLRDSQRKYGP